MVFGLIVGIGRGVFEHHHSRRDWTVRLMLLVLVVWVLGCGDGETPVSPAGKELSAARAELDRRGIPYTAGAFLSAALAGDLAVVQLFVEAGMPVYTADARGWTVLHWAAFGGDLEVVKYLLSQGADVNAWNFLQGDPRWAAGRGHSYVVSRYLDARRDSLRRAGG